VAQSVARAACRASIPEDSKVKSLIDLCIGQSPRLNMGPTAEAQLLGTSRSSLTDDITDLASGCYFGAWAWVESLVSHVLKGARSEPPVFLPLALIEFESYDETPMSACAGKLSEDDVVEASTTKLVQTEFQLGMLIRIVATGRLAFFLIHQTCPIIPLEHSCTAEHLRHILQTRLRRGYLLQSAKSAFKYVAAASVCDSGSNNLKYEAHMAMKSPWPRIRLPCDVHHLSTVCGRSYRAVSADLSGVIAVCLACRVGKATTYLRQALAEVIADRAYVVANSPPPEPHAATAALVDQCVGSDTTVEVSRRISLKHLLRGDIRSKPIPVYVDGPVAAESEKGMIVRFSKDLARHLLPRAIEMFPRHRWMTSIVSLKQIGLLASVHDLFVSAVPRWIPKLRGQRQGNVVRLPVAVPDGWDVEADDEEPARGKRKKQQVQLAASEGGPPPASAVVDWTAYNEKQRGNVLVFASTQPKGRLVLACIVLGQLVK
jgi:hypothetical protein